MYFILYSLWFYPLDRLRNVAVEFVLNFTLHWWCKWNFCLIKNKFELILLRIIIEQWLFFNLKLVVSILLFENSFSFRDYDIVKLKQILICLCNWLIWKRVLVKLIGDQLKSIKVSIKKKSWLILYRPSSFYYIFYFFKNFLLLLRKTLD